MIEKFRRNQRRYREQRGNGRGRLAARYATAVALLLVAASYLWGAVFVVPSVEGSPFSVSAVFGAATLAALVAAFFLLLRRGSQARVLARFAAAYLLVTALGYGLAYLDRNVRLGYVWEVAGEMLSAVLLVLPESGRHAIAHREFVPLDMAPRLLAAGLLIVSERRPLGRTLSALCIALGAAAFVYGCAQVYWIVGRIPLAVYDILPATYGEFFFYPPIRYSRAVITFMTAALLFAAAFRRHPAAKAASQHTVGRRHPV